MTRPACSECRAGSLRLINNGGEAGNESSLFIWGPAKKALQDRPKPEIAASTDAILKITKTTICGTDLHILKGDVPSCPPDRIWAMKASVSLIRQGRARASGAEPATIAAHPTW